ncbi:hypothetical protein BS50DRAFT_576775 [Corynespora cassiicola Philippines]|uniref:Uncharacterized protein n=1 Tax=Corynespora cassiicola Philippines TaxID=1448308 RepID=A0A2T2NGP1_CORCC|nr:hypothetical protein BS50DRAFT_576775 [Corynespora cassiicola Philippines]
MRSPPLSLLLPLLCSLFSASISATPSADIPLECAHRDVAEDAQCQAPLRAVTTVVPHRHYIAKLPCVDCPVQKDDGHGGFKLQHNIDNDLFYNITLSPDNRTVVLNGKPIFPSAPSPPSPRLSARRIRPNMTRAELHSGIYCTLESCKWSDLDCRCFAEQWAGDDSLATLDFDYHSHWIESHKETETEKWEITFDAIGGYSGIEFNDTEQLMLRIIVQGKELPQKENYPGEQDMQAASSLFGPFQDDPETQYEYQITAVELMERSYMFPPAPTPTVWWKIKHFFGWEPDRINGHLIYLEREWDAYGKKGTLRNALGNIIYGWPWDLVGIIVGSAIGGTVALYGFYRLFLLAMRQRELARWDGMDAVWEQMRAEHHDEEEDGLLGESYRDEPAGGRTSVGNYRDDGPVVKPLPSKPLPEKPLPAVPLIDA